MQGKVKRAQRGLQIASRLYIQLGNNSIWYRDFSTEKAAENALASIEPGNMLPLKQWTRYVSSKERELQQQVSALASSFAG